MFNDDNAGNGGNKYVSCWRKCLMLAMVAKMLNAGNAGDGGKICLMLAMVTKIC